MKQNHQKWTAFNIYLLHLFEYQRKIKILPHETSPLIFISSQSGKNITKCTSAQPMAQEFDQLFIMLRVRVVFHIIPKRSRPPILVETRFIELNRTGSSWPHPERVFYCNFAPFSLPLLCWSIFIWTEQLQYLHCGKNIHFGNELHIFAVLPASETLNFTFWEENRDFLMFFISEDRLCAKNVFHTIK